MSTTRRRSFVSKPSFQIKLTIIFMLMVTIVANLVGGLCFFFLSSADARTVIAKLANSPDYPDGIPVKELAEVFIPKIFVAESISLIIVFMLCIWVTHTIAGPLYRMERIAAEIGEGDLSILARLRPKDELKELADAFNVMSRKLARKIYSIKEAVFFLEDGGAPKEALVRLKASMDGFKLPTRELLWEPGAGEDERESAEGSDRAKVPNPSDSDSRGDSCQDAAGTPSKDPGQDKA